jgi:hypothetical protein
MGSVVGNGLRVPPALLFAVWKGQVGRVKEQLRRGAQPRRLLPRYGVTALAKADSLGYKDVADTIRAFEVDLRKRCEAGGILLGA